MKRGLLLVILSGCAGAPDATTPSPPAESATPVVLATATAVASAPVVPTGTASASAAAIQCDDYDLDTVLFRREHVGVPTKPGNYIDKRIKAAVIACFEEIPRDRRSTGAVHAVILEWPNGSFHGGGSGFGSGFGRGGAADYPPKVSDEAFTACVTKAIPKENVSSLDPDGSKISAIKLTVLAYTRAAADRHLSGSIGGGGAASGFGRRRCERPDRDD